MWHCISDLAGAQDGARAFALSGGIRYSRQKEARTTMVPIEAWATKIDDAADHTYVRCTVSGGKQEYFVCWGGHDGPDQRRICRSQAEYAVPDCYRGKPVGGCKDTAEIGVYAVNGVCHQSANCFLYSAGATLNTEVRGYWLTVGLYGTYGTRFDWWLENVYTPCAKGVAHPEMDALSRKLHELYVPAAATPARWGPRNRTDLIVQDAAITAEHWVPGTSVESFAERHKELLVEKDRIIGSGIVGEPLAVKLNMLARQAQDALATLLEADEYEQLIGVPPSETLDVIDPALAHIAGISRN